MKKIFLPVKIKVPRGAKIPDNKAFMGKLPTKKLYPMGIKVKMKHNVQKASIILKRLGVDLEYDLIKSLYKIIRLEAEILD